MSEFGGGIVFVLGLLTRLGALGIACTMIVAVAMQRFEYGAPFIDLSGGNSYVLAATFLTIALLLLSNGPGRYSVDRALFGVKS
jgi:putative oxidoreductase